MSRNPHRCAERGRKELLHQSCADPMTLFFTLFVPVMEVVLLGDANRHQVRHVRTPGGARPPQAPNTPRRAGRMRAALRETSKGLRTSLPASPPMRKLTQMIVGCRRARRHHRSRRLLGVSWKADRRGQVPDPGRPATEGPSRSRPRR